MTAEFPTSSALWAHTITSCAGCGRVTVVAEDAAANIPLAMTFSPPDAAGTAFVPPFMRSTPLVQCAEL